MCKPTSVRIVSNLLTVGPLPRFASEGVRFAMEFPALLPVTPNPPDSYSSEIVSIRRQQLKPTEADAHRRYRRHRALATGPDADARRRRDAALHRERQKRHRQLMSSARADTLDGLAPTDGTVDAQTSREARLLWQYQTPHRRTTQKFPSSPM